MRTAIRRFIPVVAVVVFVIPFVMGTAGAREPDDAIPSNLTERLRALDGRVFSEEEARTRGLAQMVARDVRTRRQAANRRSTRAWRAIHSRTEWEHLRDKCLLALRASLGTFPPAPAHREARETARRERDGVRIENLVFESRPGLLVTANLYQPAQPRGPMPGILICHSHHNPKTQGELQDMGMLWAGQGCIVLVPDQLGHGERRQHPFRDAASYPGSFRVGRQDYYFRYITGIQLQLAGESLIGWMVGDLMRGVDVLLARPGIDPKRIILLGAVAGGGDPAAVTAALDPRIAAVVPFNFGGPQPESVYPLPADADDSFNYAGGGSWESTRNLRLSARDGFLPWVIVGAAAPRPLIYAHEFSWDQERDPVWKRLQTIYAFYQARDHLGEVHGRGAVTGKPPTSTHCNNIGPEHRKGIYPLIQRWFDIAPPVREPSARLSVEELQCLTPDVERAFQAQPVHRLAERLGAERAAAARREHAGLAPDARRAQLRRDWAQLLGDIEPTSPATIIRQERKNLGAVRMERIALNIGDSLTVPLLLLVPAAKETRMPVVVAIAQEGKQAFLKQRPELIARLLRGGVAVCLPDVRGTGETRPANDSRDRSASSTALSASEWMLGQTLLGKRLHDLRVVLGYLRSRTDLDGSRVALWGDSFASLNAPDANLAVPLDAAKQPAIAEPLGGLLALLGALFEDNVRGAAAHGTLVSYQSLLQEPFCYLPHDALVPGVLTIGDVDDLAAAVAPRPLCVAGLVDGQNRRLAGERLGAAWEQARTAFRASQAGSRLSILLREESPEASADWLRKVLR